MCESVERVTEVLFGGDEFSDLTDDDLEVLAREIPCVPVGVGVIEALVVSETATSNSEARRLIQSGAVSVNGTKITEDQAVQQPALIKKGKNTFILVTEGEE